MKNSFVICAIGVVIFLHFIHASESLKNVPIKAASASITARHGSDIQQQQMRLIKSHHNSIQHHQPMMGLGHSTLTNPRQLRYRNRGAAVGGGGGGPPQSHYRLHHPQNHHMSAARLKPVIMRRYQTNNGAGGAGSNQNLIKYPQKIYSQLSPNYQIKQQNRPTQQHLTKSKLSHHKQHSSSSSSASHPTFNNINLSQLNHPNPNSPKFGPNHFHHGNGPPASVALKKNQAYGQGFHASTQFNNGNIIMRPGITNTQFPAGFNGPAQSPVFDFSDPNFHRQNSLKIGSKPYPSYSVYDDSDDNNNFNNQRPVQYQVALNGLKPNNGAVLDPIKLAQQSEEAKKYLSFMSSSDYFLPKPQPDYHLRPDQLNADHGKPQQVAQQQQQQQQSAAGAAPSTEDYMNVPVNVDFGSGGYQQRADGTNNNNNNVNKNANHKLSERYDPEKIEFTENDAIHSSFTSNPHEEFGPELQGNYGNGKRYKSTLRSDRINKKPIIQNDHEKWSAPIPEFSKRQDTTYGMMSDEEISKECLKKCFSDESKIARITSEDSPTDNDDEKDEDMQFGYNDREVECYESCISAYKAQN